MSLLRQSLSVYAASYQMWWYLLTDLVRCPPPCPSVQLSDKLLRRFLRSLNPQSSSEELQSFDWLSFKSQIQVLSPKSQISNLKSKEKEERDWDWDWHSLFLTLSKGLTLSTLSIERESHSDGSLSQHLFPNMWDWCTGITGLMQLFCCQDYVKYWKVFMFWSTILVDKKMILKNFPYK